MRVCDALDVPLNRKMFCDRRLTERTADAAALTTLFYLFTLFLHLRRTDRLEREQREVPSEKKCTEKEMNETTEFERNE